MILDTSTVHGDLTLSADVCVVGSGSGGSVAAAELAQGGKSVVLLEEGHYWTSDDFTQREEEMYPRLYRERGTKPTADYTVLVSQGRTLGVLYLGLLTVVSVVALPLLFATNHGSG